MKKILLVFGLLFSFSLFKTGEVQASEVADTIYYPAFPNCVTRMAVNLDISGF